ncbi:hypothetical protein BU23DRAFT_69000 [Bimuria novae-zelandiae CBS 107.79]|uniref:Transmembrane protein n=1 Tax=Bimuria novae-zelandiae CBS 107.79 TaxID=1447943 RepID=A0A6A5VED2_9PLEO|nr:hypothetical protein BU23DRAFT_69000 [Bimuria novae-zelandiae CBS 107.79]
MSLGGWNGGRNLVEPKSNTFRRSTTPSSVFRHHSYCQLAFSGVFRLWTFSLVAIVLQILVLFFILPFGAFLLLLVVLVEVLIVLVDVCGVLKVLKVCKARVLRNLIIVQVVKWERTVYGDANVGPFDLMSIVLQ